MGMDYRGLPLRADILSILNILANGRLKLQYNRPEERSLTLRF
jgi:hypothetical protein